MIAVPGKPINAGSHQEMRSNLLGQTEQLINVALAIADMNASSGCSEKVGRLPQIFQPTDTLLLFDRNPCRIDLALQRRRPLELLACPELDCGQAERKSIGRHGQARMHQDAALRAPRRLARKANQIRFLALEAEFRASST